MDINRLYSVSDSETYFDAGFLLLLDNSLAYIKLGVTKITYIEASMNFKYIGDFYGLLAELGIDKKYHYITTIFNNLKNSNDYLGDKDNIIIPDFNLVDSLKDLYITNKK